MDHTLFIGGQKIAATNHQDIRNPSTGETVGRMPLATLEQLDQAVDAATAAFRDWSQKSEDERAQACRDVAGAT